jgi:hypothetical protein
MFVIKPSMSRSTNGLILKTLKSSLGLFAVPL